MGMRVGGSGNAWASQNQSVGNWQQKQSSFKELFASLKSGDLASAQKAYASISSGSASQPANSPLAQIGKALQGGDLSAAQNLAQTMLKDRATNPRNVSAPNAIAASGPSASSSSAAMAVKVDVMV
jgi:hypothetical protein